MKINKILAAGVAATLAVTSLSAVASAEAKSIDFDMETTLGKVTYTPQATGITPWTAGDLFKFNQVKDKVADTFMLDPANVPVAGLDTNSDGLVNYEDIDAVIPLKVTASTADGVSLFDKLGTLTVTITGKKMGAIAGTVEPEVQKAKLLRCDFTGTGTACTANYILPIYVGNQGPDDSFIPERFVSIDSVKIETSGAKEITFSDLGKSVYQTLDDLLKNDKGRNLKVNTDAIYEDKYTYDNKAAAHQQLFGWTSENGFTADGQVQGIDAKLTIALAAGAAAYNPDFTADPAAVVYALTAKDAASTKDVPVLTGKAVKMSEANVIKTDDQSLKGGYLINAINNLLAKNVEITWKLTKDETKNHFAFVEKTTNNTIIYRQDCLILSKTGAWNSDTPDAKNGWTADDDQSYKDSGLGDTPRYFGGLAGQCADFFNKQTNGKIIFKFTAKASSDSWKDGGVPSTEVGLKNSLAGTAMALFFNYNQSTGSLVSIGEVDSENATITFDISSILDDMGGWTKGNISDIYYGLNKGLDYKDDTYGKRVGYIVEKVTLQYDDAPAAVDPATDDDADDDAAVVVADDDDDDDVAADDDVIADDDDDIAEDDDIIEDDDDDDDAGEIIADDDDDDDDVNNEVDYVDADDDANPGTGVGLAVIPAIVAAAAAIVSKKRK